MLYASLFALTCFIFSVYTLQSPMCW